MTIHKAIAPEKVSIWLDCDTGHDDAFAILLAALAPNASLLGISTTYGNATLAHTTYNTRAVLKAIGREDVPVFAGAARPFCREIACAPDIHGETGLDGTTHLPVPTVPARVDKTAVEAMYEALSSTTPGTAWLVATGALTNVALLLSIYPRMAEHVAGLSLMGGAVGNGFTDAPLGRVAGQGTRIGNWTPWAEFNIYIDPESARAVFDNSMLCKKIIMLPLDITHQFLATKEVQEMVLHGASQTADTNQSSSPTRTLFHEILMFFASTYADVFGITQGPPLHDALAVAIILYPQLFDNGGTEKYKVSIVTDGAHGACPDIRSGKSQCGRTLVTPAQIGRSDGVKIPRTLDRKAVWNLINDCLSTAERLTSTATQ